MIGDQILSVLHLFSFIDLSLGGRFLKGTVSCQHDTSSVIFKLDWLYFHQWELSLWKLSRQSYVIIIKLVWRWDLYTVCTQAVYTHMCWTRQSWFVWRTRMFSARQWPRSVFGDLWHNGGRDICAAGFLSPVWAQPQTLHHQEICLGSVDPPRPHPVLLNVMWYYLMKYIYMKWGEGGRGGVFDGILN